MQEQLEAETQTLKEQLHLAQAQAAQNQSAHSILSQFVESGQAAIQPDGSVQILPNRIQNQIDLFADE